MIDFFNRGYSVKELNRRSKRRLLKVTSNKKGFTKKKNINKKRKKHYNGMKEGLEQYRIEREINEVQRRYCEHLKMEEKDILKRGDIVYCNLEDIGEGSEQAGKRPGIVVQNDTGNKYSSTTIVVFLTSKIKTELPTHVHLKCGVDYTSLKETHYSENIALCEQVRTISKSRIIHKIGRVKPATMRKIEKALLISQGIEPNNYIKYKY